MRSPRWSRDPHLPPPPGEVMEATEVESCPGFKQRCILGPVVGGLESRLLTLGSRDGDTVTCPGLPEEYVIVRGACQRLGTAPASVPLLLLL